MRNRPTVEVCVVRGAVDWRGLGECTIASWPVSPDDAYQVSKQPITDVRAIAIGGSTSVLSPRRKPVERLWAITVVSLIEEEAFPLLDEVVEKLLDDVHAGRVQPGTHRGELGRYSSSPFEAERRRVEAELAAFRRKFLADLGAAGG